MATTRRRLLPGIVSLAGHLAVLAAVLVAHGDPPTPEPEPMSVALVTLPPPQPPAPKPAPRPDPAPPSAAKPSPVPPPPPKVAVRRARAPSRPVPMPVGEKSSIGQTVSVSEAEAASAATAGSGVGAGGRSCDMIRRLQAALRKDARVQAAVAQARRGGGTGAMLVWNGDWIRSNGEEGEGLAAVREAIMWEVGFAPEACRAEPVRGLVLISLADGPGSNRLVVGGGSWRWSDLLHPRRGG